MSLPLPEQQSRNRSASAGESGLPKHEHKRPRLSHSHDDNQETSMVTPTVTNDNSTSQPSHPLTAVSTQTDSSVASPPKSPLPTTATSDITSPQSKVTINTRPISSQSSTVYGQRGSTDGAMDSVQPQSTIVPDSRHSTPSNHGNQEQPISISSSECGSPLIQVAVPEDIDQDPIDTQWEPISGPSVPRRLSIHSGHVKHTFPYLQQSSKAQPQAIVTSIARILTEGATNDEEVFHKVKIWITDLAENATSLSYKFFQEEHEFWLSFPSIITGLLKRKVALPAKLENDDLIAFFVAYIRVASLVLAADTAELQSIADVIETRRTFHFYSMSFLPPMHFIVATEDAPLYDTIQESFFMSSAVVIARVTEQLTKSHFAKHITDLSILFQAMADLFPKRTSLIELGLNIVLHASMLTNSIAGIFSPQQAQIEGGSEISTAIVSASSTFLQTVDAVLDRAITKQQPWLNIDTCEKAVKVVGNFVGVLAAHNHQLANDSVQTANVNPSRFSSTELATVAALAWRFSMLHKCIKKGRMEVRVASVQLMASQLVEIYHQFINTMFQDHDHPIVRFMVQFIRDNNMIRYIIGVDSHPQIIERSGNIIGFLCVSHSYRNEDTDVIWQTILESQDSRAVVALLGAFQQNFDTLTFDVIAYLTKKLLLLRFDRVDHHMLDFVVRLLHSVDFKSSMEALSDETSLDVHECILKFCTKMLREAGTPDNAPSESAGRIRQQINAALSTRVKQLRARIRPGKDKELMKSIFEELCNDIRTHNGFASGSALAFGIILNEIDDEECSRIVLEHDLASILVDDIVETCNTSSESASEDLKRVDLESRLSLLIKLVFRTSNAITAVLIKALWVNVLANPNLQDELRSMAWKHIASVFKVSRERNQFLDTLTEEYLPILRPELLSSAVFGFIKNSVQYETYHTPSEVLASDEVVSIPGIERVWTVMLTTLSNTVETEAILFITEQYLDSDRVLRQDASSIEATHLSLIDRCVEQVIDAANRLTAGPTANMNGSSAELPVKLSESQQHLLVLRFYRSLQFLRKFLDVLKTRPRYMPTLNGNLKEALRSFDAKGQTFEVVLQIIGHRTLANVQLKWVLGYENSGHEVWQFLSELTGWPQFSVISGGKRLSLKEDQGTLNQLGLKSGSLMINKVQGSPETNPARVMRETSPVDRKVMHHFDALYSLLDLEDQLAKEVFDFLRMFSSQDKVVQRLKSMSIDSEDLLPVDKPFKLMYYAKALRSCLEEESYSSEPNTVFLDYGVKTILSVLPRLEQLKVDTVTYVSIAQGLVEALNLIFRAKVPIEVSQAYISDGVTFSKDLMSLWSKTLAISGSNPGEMTSSILVRALFEALIEGLLHDEQLWSKIDLDAFKSCLEQSFLVQSTRDIRQAMLEVLNALAGVLNAKSATKVNSTRNPRMRFPIAKIDRFLEQLWSVLVTMIPQANSAFHICAEFFEALLSIFRQCQRNFDEVELQNYIVEWKSVLLTHQHIQYVGLPSQDSFVSSLGKLLLQALKIAQQQRSVDPDVTFVRDVFSRFLFPPLSDVLSFDARIGSRMQQQNPVLDMHTRWVLYEILIVLSSDTMNLDTIYEELSDDLVPRDFNFLPVTNSDRLSLRSEVGYSGLRNLSNTCYLNSLLSQLFMNVEFRELVMNVNIIDHSNQKLIAELGKVFAYMQTSYEEAVSPESAVESITLWDGDKIDVTVQMDVDEFFNLLFDRLESQIIDTKVCSAFKQIYGGQLVQQIKSKECEHVSERLEPFTAVQVEIKGKATLEESLRAYVEGEVLQGENKYSCTGCGKHVDAVKRACLKTVPNHLIFNLKRFDYDILTGMRCKVNDEFGFPPSINMSPYTLEALSNPDQPPIPDMFELVGVIIHSGTAESGHYYSYVRQRPSKMSTENSWVQFNDHDVSQFDPGSIRECCFGGIDFGAIQCPKFYNGYMLFYQRASSMQAIEHKYLNTKSVAPVRLSLEPRLEAHISQHNELFLRTYVAQDPVHARFVKALLQQKATNDQIDCSLKHEPTAARLLTLALDNLHQLSARWKELPEVDETLTLLRNYAQECVSCAQVILKWLMKEERLVDNLTRSCYATVRKGFTNLVVTCWQKWSVVAREASANSADSRGLLLAHTYLTNVGKFLGVMANGTEYLQRYGRAWDNYFGILQVILRLGQNEARLVVEAGFLELSLEFVHMHVYIAPIPKRMKAKYSTYLLQRERNRPFPHGLLVSFLVELLQHVDFVGPVSDYQDRATFDDRVSLSSMEASLLGFASANPNLIWLKKIIIGRSNPQGAEELIRQFCGIRQFDLLLCNLLKDGLAERSLIYATAFLQPTIVFISCCYDQEVVSEVVEEALTLIETTSGQHSKDFLVFIQTMASVVNNGASIPRGGLVPLIKKLVPQWAPVLLMAPNELHSDVRSDTLDLLNEVLFQDMDTLQRTDINEYHVDVLTCKSLAKTCATYAESAFIRERAPILHAGQASQASTVVDHCLRFFGENASDEDEATRITAIMEEFKARVEGVVETITDNDWNASSDLEAMSEVDNMSDASN